MVCSLKKRFLVWGPNNPDYWETGSERLMFIGDYDDESYSACSEFMFSTYKAADSCCKITGTGTSKEVHFITMASSETRGPDISIKASIVFDRFRGYAKQKP